MAQASTDRRGLESAAGNPAGSGTARMRTAQQRQGDWAEHHALTLLEQRGWRLLDRQWRCRWGELDLVLRKGERLLLVEVKARRAGSLDGGGRLAMGPAKRQRLERSWDCWLAAHGEWRRSPVEMVAALVPLPPGEQPVRWIRLEF